MENAHSVDRRPAAGTKTGRVWQVADRISQQQGHRATPKQVIEEFVRQGGNRSTAATQYVSWKSDYDSRFPVDAAGPHRSSAKIMLQVGADGRVLIPAELRSLMMIGEDGRLSARVEQGELRLISPNVALQRLRKLVREQDSGSGSVVDELIAERRKEAGN